jgi:hypothetical protein
MRPGGGEAIQAAGSIDGKGRARQLPACVEEERGFSENPPRFLGFFWKKKNRREIGNF